MSFYFPELAVYFHLTKDYKGVWFGASSMTNTRLYNRPPKVLETLSTVVGGATSNHEVAEELELSENAVKNYIHDVRGLELVEKRNGELNYTKEARRVVQLQDDEILEEKFLELPGVTGILERIDKERSISFEDIGRLVAFETESNATDPNTFRAYGLVYAKWLEYLEYGYIGKNAVYDDVEEINQASSSHVLENPHGAISPKVRPNTVIESIPYITEVESTEELAERLDYTERWTRKILSTCYALQLAESNSRIGMELTDTGKELRTASEGRRSKILRDALLDIPFVQAFCIRVPEGKFSVADIVDRVSTDYGKGWSEGTIKTKGKRLYQWLIFTELAEEVNQGTLIPTDILKNCEITDPGGG